MSTAFRMSQQTSEPADGPSELRKERKRDQKAENKGKDAISSVLQKLGIK